MQLVYTWYIDGDGTDGPLPISNIARKLSAMQMPTYADAGTRTRSREKERAWGQWNRSAIHDILRSETYAGVWRYGKRARRNGKTTQNPDDDLLAVEVPPIVSRDVWEAAQERLTENRRKGGTKPKHEYLMSKRLRCGRCGLRMTGGGTQRKRRLYLYCRCPVGSNRGNGYARTCDMPSFDAERVDSAVWDWVESLLSDPVALTRGLIQHQQERDQANEPLRQRLQVVDDLLTDNKKQLDRLLDLYLASDFPREALTERKARLETTGQALENERASLAAQLEAQSLTDEQIQSLEGFARKIAEGLVAAERDFETRRAVIEALDVHGTLVIEDGERIAYVQCILRKEDSVLRLLPRVV